jgi:cysteine desulfurase
VKKIYLDYAAAAPMEPEVLEAMRPYFFEKFQNPSATYLTGPAEVIFTAGATEANNLAIQGIMNRYPGAEVLTSSIEHESVLAPAGRFKHKLIPVDSQGLIILNKLSNLINDKTVLVSIMLVNNEVGTIQPLRDVAALIKGVVKDRRSKGSKTPLYLHTDAAQAANYLDLQVSRLGVDLMSLNGGKIYGPKQSGGLYIRAGVELEPLIAGGGQEFNLRSGTENLAAAAGFAKALELASQNRHSEVKRVTELREDFEKQLLDKIPAASTNGSAHHRAPHITSLTIEGIDNERTMFELDELGIECAVGSACNASSDEPSYVLSAIGLSGGQARSTLRFSFGRRTTKAELEKTAAELVRLTTK